MTVYIYKLVEHYFCIRCNLLWFVEIKNKAETETEICKGCCREGKLIEVEGRSWEAKRRRREMGYALNND